ncbi:hypothetical protein CEXT_232151 [Caerostris extrusa]|uniref:Uncharacterized protein n=1 Tax=Caerostris extrusa TaxID=172846 RepID=A0AAV4SZV7_CAEEX|nr:hypothetical protein CEXT_232151 [Caerostris extrusa]
MAPFLYLLVVFYSPSPRTDYSSSPRTVYSPSLRTEYSLSPCTNYSPSLRIDYSHLLVQFTLHLLSSYSLLDFLTNYFPSPY